MTLVNHDVIDHQMLHIRVLDEWQDSIPDDLYIPPAAFEILLEHFEGPLDFLIYLIYYNLILRLLLHNICRISMK